LKRFTIAAGGEPLIVHNCENVVQAIARDCLYYVLQKLKQMQLLFHVHDEAVMNSRKGGQDLETALEVMGEEIPWAPGLPLAGDGHVLPFYMKAD
jgi:DNA polymerase